MQNWALPEINMELSDRCGACVAGCPAGAVEMMPKGPSFARPADCTYCAACETICPRRAIACRYEIVWEAED